MPSDQTPTAPTPARRPDVIVDFDLRDGLLFVSLKNIGEASAYAVTTRFDPAFRGLDGRKDIGGMRMFRRLDFMAPGKTFVQLVDPLRSYVQRGEPMNLTASISYSDRDARQYEDTMTHDLRVYVELGEAGVPARPLDLLSSRT